MALRLADFVKPLENELLAVVPESRRDLTPQVRKHLVCAVFVYAVDRQPLLGPAFASSVVVDVENRDEAFRDAHVDYFLHAVEEHRAYLVLRIVHAELTPPRHRHAHGVDAFGLVQAQKAPRDGTVAPLRLVAARAVQRVADVYAKRYVLHEIRRTARKRRGCGKPHRAGERTDGKHYGKFVFHWQYSIAYTDMTTSPCRMIYERNHSQ